MTLPDFVFKTFLFAKGLFQEVYTMKRLLLNQLALTVRNRIETASNSIIAMRNFTLLSFHINLKFKY